MRMTKNVQKMHLKLIDKEHIVVLCKLQKLVIAVVLLEKAC